MRKETRVSSNYGPVDCDLVLCDNLECNSVAQEKYAVNWYQLSVVGISARTMGDPLEDESEYCSLKCLKERLKSTE